MATLSSSSINATEKVRTSVAIANNSCCGQKEEEEDEENGVAASTVISDCYCPNCGQNHATTTMLTTTIPFFRQIILMTLLCDECHFRNSEVHFAGEIEERGERIRLRVTTPADLERQLVKSDSATLSIPQLELEIPPGAQRGTVSTLEGFLKQAASNLEALQKERLLLGDLDNFYRCKRVIEGLQLHYEGGKGQKDDTPENSTEIRPRFPFEVILDDPAGCSIIENPWAPDKDPHLTIEKYFRTPTQDMALGLQPSRAAREAGWIDDTNPNHKNKVNSFKDNHRVEVESAAAAAAAAAAHSDTLLSIGRQEAVKFDTPCPNCQQSAETAMSLIDIPFFKEIIIMGLICEHCGYRSNEIKAGGSIPKNGTNITLSIRDEEDLKRELLMSDTAGIVISEIHLELDQGGIGGVYTTVEGLLKKLLDRLKSANPFASGDSAEKHHLTNDGGEFSKTSVHVKYKTFLKKLEDIGDGRMFPVTLILNDPMSNSFVGPIPNIALSDEQASKGLNDDGLAIEVYERSPDQNEMLGLSHMKTENYASNANTNYGTDQMENRTRPLECIGGLDHPHETAKAPVKNDNTIMGSET